jgi:peptide deformylase
MSVDPSFLRLVVYPAEVLRRKAKPVERVDDEVRAVAHRMIQIMHEEEGVGLAAPQVGLGWRMFVTAARAEGEADRVYINPALSELEGLESMEEGCLSLPGIRADIRRPAVATITATGLDGKEFTTTSNGFLARVWQHELDHLDGILILNRMTPLDRLATRKAVKELEAAGG